MKRILFIILALCLIADARPRRRRRRPMARYYLHHEGTGYVSWSSTDELNASTGVFTVSVWLKGIVQVQKSSAGGTGWSIATLLNQAVVSSGGVSTVTSTTDLDDGDWHHIVFTRDSSHLLSLYVDGSLEGATQSTSKDIDNTGDLRTTTGNTGDIDELRFYKGVVLSADQISNIYNMGYGVRVKENGFGRISANGFYASCDDGSGTTVSGRKITSGTWSDHNGSFTSGDLTWKEGGIPLHSVQLSSDYEEHTGYINTTSKRIQFEFIGAEDFAIREFKVHEPTHIMKR